MINDCNKINKDHKINITFILLAFHVSISIFIAAQLLHFSESISNPTPF